MDQSQIAPGAVAPQSAAEPNVWGAPPESAAQPFGSNPPAPEPVQSAPAPEAAPDSAASPQATPAPAPVIPPEYQQAMEKARQLDQVQAELQRLAADAQRQQAYQQAQQQFQSQRDQIYQVASGMTPEDGHAYIRRQEDQLHAAHLTRMQQIEQQAEQRMMAAVAQVAAPLYAQEIAKKNGLPPEYADRLAMLNPQQMDAYLPVIKREFEAQQATAKQLADLKSQLDQFTRSQQASQAAQSPTGVATGAGSQPSYGANGPTPGSREHLMSLLGPLFGGAS